MVASPHFPKVSFPVEPAGYPEWRRIERWRRAEHRANGILTRELAAPNILNREAVGAVLRDPISIAGTQVASFILLKRLHAYLSEGKRELESIIGTKLCSEFCCCIRTTPYITRIEAEYIVSRTGYYSDLVDIAERWLTHPHPEAPTYPSELPGIAGGTFRQAPNLVAEVKALHNLRSPYLLAPEHPAHRTRFVSGSYLSTGFAQGQNWDLLEDTQPLSCITTGLTKLSPAWCHRTRGLGESDGAQMIADPASLREHANALWGFCQRNAPDKLYFGMLPTMLMRVANPRRFEELAKSGKIALAKLGVSQKVLPPNTYPIKLWQ